MFQWLTVTSGRCELIVSHPDVTTALRNTPTIHCANLSGPWRQEPEVIAKYSRSYGSQHGSMWVLEKRYNLKCMVPEASLWKIPPITRNFKMSVGDLVLINA
jgi:hypothetical protein